jgi:hypothetical protein
MMNWSVIGVARVFGALALGAALAWQAIERSGPDQSEVIVHVSEGGVEVQIDERTYCVATAWDNPIVCELAHGQHVLSMTRAGKLLYHEEFTLGRGEQRVLTAWDATRLNHERDALVKTNFGVDIQTR